MTSSRDDQPGDLPEWLPADASGVLEMARSHRAEADRLEAELLQLAVQWAVQHPAESIEDAETYRLHGQDTPIPVAGEGAPLIAEFSVAEFAAAVGVGTEAGKRYVGQALELRYRLKKLWARVVAGDLAAWKARQVADQTSHLSVQAAKYVDKHVAPVAHKVRPAQLTRLVTEAITRFMPDQAEQDRKKAWDQRGVDIDFGATGIAGTCPVYAELDLADAIDLHHAVVRDASEQARLGSTLSLDQRRSVALGNIARRDLTLTLTTSDPDTQQPQQTRKPRRREMVLYVHTTDTALTSARGQSVGQCVGESVAVGRVENTRTPVLMETIRTWCGNPNTTVVVKPVIDLADHIHVEAYEIPDRIREAVALRDHSCVFPWCTRPARRLKPDEHGADCDHITAYTEGGQTCTCQLAPLCRQHHRLKTHGGWRYQTHEPGTYHWVSPHGYHYLRDHTGTQDVSRDTRPPPEPDPPDS
jgi:hypothetical protein